LRIGAALFFNAIRDTWCCVFGIVGGRHNVLGSNPNAIDSFSTWGQPTGDRDSHATTITEGIDILHRPFAKGAFTEQYGVWSLIA
jgi:hypothetical protein